MPGYKTVVLALLALLPTAGHAGTFTDVAQQLDAADRTAPSQKARVVRVQVTYQFQITANPTDSIEQQQDAIAKSHATIYKMAAKECDQIQIVLPGECHIASMTIDNRAQSMNQQSALFVSAQIGFELARQ